LKRYCFLIIRRPEMSERALAELIVHLRRMAHGDGFVAGLTSAQWTALRYFARANRFSRTPSAFAEFHGTTRGTASQTTKSLVAQGYLARTRSQADGRSARLDLTDKARAILADDPFEALVRAAGALPPRARGHLANSLERMLGHVAREHGKQPFGMCTSCEHLQGDGCCREGMPAYQCGFVGEPLADAELQQLCINFEPGRNSAMKRTFANERPQ
jgi:DNA-binding MarR family transcriptional regulator